MSRGVIFNLATGSNSISISSGQKSSVCFTAPASGAFNGVSAYMDAASSPVGTVSLYNAGSDELPTGSALETVTASFGSYALGLTTAWAGTTNVTAGNKYCIVYEMTSGSASPSIGGISVYTTLGATYNGTDWVLNTGFGFGANYAIKIGSTWYGSRVARYSTGDLTSNQLYNSSGSRLARLGSILRPNRNAVIYGVWGLFYKVGTPTSIMKCQIYNGATLLGTSNVNATVTGLGTTGSGQQARTFQFGGSGIAVSSGNEYRIVFYLDGTSGNDSSNYVVVRAHATQSSTAFPTDDANCLDCMIGGTWATAETITDPDDWTDYRAYSGFRMPVVAVIGEYTVGGTGNLVGPSNLVS